MNTKRKSAPLGAGLVVLSSVAYGSYGVWATLMGKYFGDFTQGVLRSAVVILILLPIAIYRKQLTRIHWKRDRWLYGGILLSSLLIAAPFYYAINKIGIGLTNIIYYASIILGAFIFGRVMNNEKFTKDKLLATVVGLIGLGLVFAPGAKTFGFLAMLAAICSGFGAGLNMVVVKKIQYNVSQTMLLAWSGGVIANIPFIFIFREHFPLIQADRHWFYLLLFGLASVTASALLISGLKLIEAGAAGILGLLEIVFGVIFGIVFFHEHLSFIVVIGMLFIMTASAIPYIQHYRIKEVLEQ